MACPINMPSGMVLEHRDTRIVFVEAIDGMVLRFVRAGTEDEYFVEAGDGTPMRLTVHRLLDEFESGNLREITAGEATLSEWRGRFLGLDRATILGREPTAVMKYDLAVAAIVAGLPRSAAVLEEFAKEFCKGSGFAPSGRSIIRWINNLTEHGERVGAMKNRSGRERGRSQLPPIVDRLVHQSMAIHHSDRSIGKMGAYALVVHAWKELERAGVKGIGAKAPSKTAVVNRCNRCENKDTWALREGPHEANRHFLAAGATVPLTMPFQLVEIDGTELEQVLHFSAEARIPSAKLKMVYAQDAYSKFVFPTTPFAGPYRSEMGMRALLGVLTAPVLDSETKEKNPERVLFFGPIGWLRADNDKAVLPPSSLGNIANLVTRIELAKKYTPDEKPNVENFHGFVLRRLAGLPGTVLSARSRRRSIRADPLAEASITRADLARHLEELRLEWNDTGRAALGQRSPNDLMREHVLKHKVRFRPPGEVERNLARTIPAVLTTDGIVHDAIRYKWNRTGVTKLLSENLAAQHFATRLDGTARCDVVIKVYDWDLDRIEVLNDKDNQFVALWSDDPDYTQFLTRYEHKFHQTCMIQGATGAQTLEQKALRRAVGLQRAWADMHEKPFTIAKAAAAVLECAEVREQAKNIKDDPDLTNFEHLLMPTRLGGIDRKDVPFGPKQKRRLKGGDGEAEPAIRTAPDGPDWGGLGDALRSNQQMLDAELENDPDQGIDWGDGTSGEDDDESA